MTVLKPMEQVLRYQIPALHPIIVHFPIVLVVLSALAILVWLLRDRLVWLTAGLLVQSFALLGCIAAYLSGEEMERQSEGVPIVDELVHLHEDAALLATWLVGISLAAMMGAHVKSRHDSTRPGSPLWIRLLVVLLLVAAAVFVFWTGRIGGTMVWGVPR